MQTNSKMQTVNRSLITPITTFNIKKIPKISAHSKTDAKPIAQLIRELQPAGEQPRNNTPGQFTFRNTSAFLTFYTVRHFIPSALRNFRRVGKAARTRPPRPLSRAGRRAVRPLLPELARSKRPPGASA